MDPWHQFWNQFFFQLSTILPYVAAGAAGLIALSLTPLGRGLTRYLRESRSSQGQAAGLEETLSAIRADLAEVLERQDFLERALAQHRLPPEAANPAAPDPSRIVEPPSSRVRTPTGGS